VSDRIALLGDAVKTLGWPTLAGFARVGHSSGFRDAERFEASLRARRFAICYLLLLPPAAVSGNGSSEKSVPPRAGRGSKEILISADWVRHPTGACASADQRAEEGKRVAGLASVETASLARDAKKEEARCEESAFLEIW